MVIVHSIIGQLCLRGRCVGGIHDTYISVHTPCYRCVCKNWHCARVTRPQPARYRATRGPSTALPPPRLPLVPQKYHPQDLSLSVSLSLSSFAITRHPCSATFVALRSPRVTLRLITFYVSPFPFFFFFWFFSLFWFFALELFLEGNGRRLTGYQPVGCADRAFLNYARFMRGCAREHKFALGSERNGETVTKGRLRP